MKNTAFLAKLKKQKNLKVIDPSTDISEAYLIKSSKCIQVADLVYNAKIYENAISEAYYAIYNTILALFHHTGIKCENHTASVIILKEYYKLSELSGTILEFKKDRIDNQYYIPINNSEKITKNQCKTRIQTAKECCLELKSYIKRISNQKTKEIRESINSL
jgi:uncharacterized protein (UPF0332 family)